MAIVMNHIYIVISCSSIMIVYNIVVAYYFASLIIYDFLSGEFHFFPTAVNVDPETQV